MSLFLLFLKPTDRADSYSNWTQDFAIASTMLKEANVVVRFIPRLADLPDVSEENG